MVRDQSATVVLEGEHTLAAFVEAVTADECAVPDEERAFGVPEIAQDVRAADSLQEIVELLEHELQLRAVGRVDRDELAARTARGGLRVDHHHHGLVAQEL